jgi:hypothetical protein
VAGLGLSLSDEIQSYDSSIAKPGAVDLTWHDNYTASDAPMAAFPGGLSADHTLSGVTAGVCLCVTGVVGVAMARAQLCVRSRSSQTRV